LAYPRGVGQEDTTKWGCKQPMSSSGLWFIDVFCWCTKNIWRCPKRPSGKLT
jgi:hypothetical protein